MNVWSRRAAMGCLASFLLAAGAAVAAGQQGGDGAISGRVIDAATGRPLADASVVLVGTTRGARTSADGMYRIGGVAAGVVQLRLQRLGYASMTQTVTVTPGQTAAADFSATASATTLQEVVSTVTGQQRRIELGNTVPVIEVSKVLNETPPINFGTLLAGRAANVEVQQGAATGAGTRIRIRGATSLSLNNDPVFFVDGARIESAASSLSTGVGGTTPSRINDLVPAEFESVEIIKGPSAATLYGTNAANGVVNITTKRGRTGPPKWSAWAELGTLSDVTAYPDAYYYFGRSRATGAPQQCFLATIAAGTCIGDSLSRFNPLLDPVRRPFATGQRRVYGVQLSGGSDAARYFLSATSEGQEGVFRMPAYERARLELERGAAVPDEQIIPNALKRTSLRANVSMSPTAKTDITVATQLVLGDLRLPYTDNAVIGLFSNALGGPGRTDLKSSVGVPLYGYRQIPPGDTYSHTTTQSVNRFIGSAQGSYRPTEWLSTRATVGLDFAERRDLQVQALGSGPHVFGLDQGTATDNRAELFQYTADAGATATFSLSPVLRSKTSVGVQYYQHVSDEGLLHGEQLGPGIPRVTSAAVKNGEQIYGADKTIGGYFEQTVTYAERLFLTAAMRGDGNSAFGQDFKAVYYPKVSASWLVSEESFFPRSSVLSEARLRAAYGQSGQQPISRAALAYFTPLDAVINGQVIPGLTVGSLGNPSLKPERSSETEFGADIGFWENRYNLELTHYSKRTQDALIARLLPPSFGGPQSAFENLGAVRNSGDEIVLRGTPVRRAALGVDFALSYARNTNLLLKLGDGIPPIIGTTIQEREGYPLFGYWARPYTFADRNGNGIIEPSEVTIADSAIFVGKSQPAREVTLSGGIDLFDKHVRIAALFNHKGGHKLLNGSQRIRCQSRNNCREASDPSAPLELQARAIAARVANFTQYGFMEDADFTKLREASITFIAPARWAARLNATSASLTVSGRNLRTWTSYTGLDPESSYGQTDIPSDFQTLPSPRYFIVRLNLGL
ncbi:MAG: SusC/RagA family TonB-linked outer membrane protein [Gemmatimonadaceae bacterium]